MFIHESNTNLYEVYDCCYGIIKDRTKAGTYIKLDNEEIAFAYKFSSLLPGTKVLCTVLKLATETKFKLVSVDAVLYPSVT